MAFDGAPPVVRGITGGRCAEPGPPSHDGLLALARCRRLLGAVRRLAARQAGEDEAERLARAETMDAVVEARAASLRAQGVRAWQGIRLHPLGLDVELAVGGRVEEALVWDTRDGGWGR